MSENENNSPENNKSNPFGMPENYFDTFRSRMLLKIELTDELKEFKLLSGIEKKLPFVTPENYFAQAGLESKVELAPYEKLIAVKKENSFITPELYFETARVATVNKIEVADELKEFVTLSNLEKQNAFAVPNAYFENLSHEIREKIFAEKNKTGVFDNVLHIVFSKKTVYALAATLVLSLGLYFYNSTEKVVTTDCGTLACLDRKDILKDNQLLPLDEESLMEMVNVESLSKNLDKSLETATGKDAEKSSADKKEKEDYVIENVDVNDIVDEI
jgi:hypothetical protein